MRKQVTKYRISGLILSLAAILTAISPAKLMAHDFLAGEIAYNIENDHAIVTYKGNYSSNTYQQSELNIPAEVTYKDVTYPVTAIGNYAFNSCHMLKNITLPSTITEIRAGAFLNCNSLTSLLIPESVDSIGDYALQCRNLKSLSLYCRHIGKYALKGLYSLELIDGPDATEDGRCLIIDGVLRLFAPSGIMEYDLPESINIIDSDVFSDNAELEIITLPTGLTTIRTGAFNNCKLLKQVNIPSTVRTIESAFNCKSLTTVMIEDINSYCHITGCNSYYTPLFNTSNIKFVDYENNPILDIVFPGDIKVLKSYLFARSSIRTLTVEEGVEEIDSDAMRDCKYLTSVSIPASVSKIGNASFRGCTRLTDLVYGATNATAGYHVKEDREDEHSYIFTDCPSLTHVELLGSVTNIPDYLFAQSNIKSICFPASVQAIGSAVFSLGNLEEALFEGTPELQSVFSGCSKLRKVTVASPEPPTASSYMGTVSSANLYVPEGTADLYAQAPGWSNFKNILSEPLPGNVGHIFEYDGLRFEITDQERLLCKVISPEAGKDYCAKIAIPQSATAAEGQSYSVTEIDDAAFTYTSKLSSIYVPNSIVSISGMDNTTAGLKEITVDDDNMSYRSIDGVLFDKDATTLLLYPAAKEGPYTVPQTVKSVGTKLAAKINLEDLTISDSVEGHLVMSNSPSLKSLKIGAGVTSFSVANCPALEYLEIGSGVQYVKGEDFGAGYHDLWDTRNIRNLVFADSPDPILIYTMSVDDGYIEAIPTSNCRYVYIGRDLKAAGSPLRQHFSSSVEHVAFGPAVTRLDVQLLQTMQYETRKITVPSVNFWASTPRLFYGSTPGYSLYIDGAETPDLLITSEKVVERAFYNVNNIETITLSEDVHIIGANAFSSFQPLKSLILDNPDPDSITLEGNPLYQYDMVTLYVPFGTKSRYENAEYWKNFTNIVERPFSGVENTPLPLPYTETNPAKESIYNLQGQPVDSTNITHGLYIKRKSNGEVSKVIL